MFSCRRDGTRWEEWQRLLDTREPVSSLSHPLEKSHAFNACNTETQEETLLSWSAVSPILLPSNADFHMFIFHAGLPLIIQ